MKGHLWPSSFNPGLWVRHPSLEVPAVVGEEGGEYDSSPRNLDSSGKSCAGNVTSLAKVPGKCQNKMCWLRAGDEKPFLAALKQVVPLPNIHLRQRN